MSITEPIATEYRETKYCSAIRSIAEQSGHATNAQILNILRVQFPAISATTVHRVTSRLLERGELALAPSALDGSIRYDSNTTEHDHYMCLVCGNVQDINIAEIVIPVIQKAMANKQIQGRLTVSGSCTTCVHI